MLNLFKVNNKNTMWHCSRVFSVNFEHVHQCNTVFLFKLVIKLVGVSITIIIYEVTTIDVRLEIQIHRK